MSFHAWLALACGSMLATCLASLGGRSLRQFSRHDLEEICRRRKQPERFGDILRTHQRVALGVEIAAVVCGSLLVVICCAWWITQNATRPVGGIGLLAVGLLLGVALAAIFVWIPWALSRIFAELFLFHTWPVWQFVSRVTSPLAWGALLIDALAHRLVGRTPHNPNEESFEEEIRTIVTEGHREGLLEEDAREMIEGVIELGDADVSEIMTPRTDMHTIQADLPWDEMVRDVITAGHTRVPVFDKNRDDIIGVLYSKDLLPELTKDPQRPPKLLRDLIRKPVFVPETKRVDDVLEMFQQMRTHIAVVLDEYGGVSGLVTIEDVLEEIVGEIVDEYDEDVVEEIQRINETTCEALGRAHVDEINDVMGLQLPDDRDFDTIGGFVFTELGQVPLPGQKMVWDEAVEIEVLEATKRRIDRVRIQRLEVPNRDIA